jgi:hypothetical protein
MLPHVAVMLTKKISNFVVCASFEFLMVVIGQVTKAYQEKDK